MKTLNRFLLILMVAIFSSCQGDQGPMGPPGEDGFNILGTVFETDPITFSAANNYEYLYSFPSNFEIIDGDVVMVYILWEIESNMDVWRALPQTIFLNDGVLQYNFDYTLGDVKIFLGGTIDPAVLGAGDTDNQIFRIAVIPADLAMDKSINLNDYNAVMSAMKLRGGKIEKLSVPSISIVK